MKNSMSITEYSLLAVALASYHKSTAEVVYTDIDDVIIDDDFETYYLDFDGDGTEDYKLFKFSGTNVFTDTFGNYSTRRFNSIWVQPGTIAGIAYNGIAGMSTSTYSGGPSYWPYALIQGDLINNELDFNKFYGREILASRLDVIVPSGTVIGWMDAGYWYPSLEDRYIGVHFRDIDNKYHYGWIRCSVLDSAEVLIIKDYAYETEFNYPIVAGDTISYVGVENPQINDLATIYSFGSHVYIKSKFNQSETTVSVMDMSGKCVYNAQCTEPYLDIDLSYLSTGNYIVAIDQGSTNFKKQVFLIR